jgi:hypothetical protein
LNSSARSLNHTSSMVIAALGSGAALMVVVRQIC